MLNSRNDSISKNDSLSDKGKKIKVALVCSTLNQLGGPNRHFERLYKGLDKDKFEVTLFICSKREKEVRDFMLQEGIPEEDLVFLSRFKKWFLVPFILDLRRIFLDKKIGIVHTFHAQTDIFGGIAGRLAGIRCLVSQFESKVVEDNILVAKRFFYKFGNMLVRKYFKKTIAVSEGLRRELVSTNFRSAESIEVIYLGYDLPLIYREQILPLDGLLKQEPLIGTVARFDKEKGLERFIKTIPLILREVPQARFVIFGKGPEEGRLKGLTADLGVADFVDFGGWVADVNSALEKMDIFVMPSLREGCPNILLEVLALRRPVVASRIEGIEDIIENGKDGLLVNTADTGAFAQAIIFLCKNSAKAIEVGKNGEEKVRTQFNMQREISQIEKVYLDVLEDTYKEL